MSITTWVTVLLYHIFEKMILFFAVFFERFEEIAVGAEAVFAGNRVFEEKSLEGLESERHIATKENK